MTAGVAAPKRVSKGLTFRRWFIPSGAWSYELPGMCRKAASKRDERLEKQWGGDVIAASIHLDYAGHYSTLPCLLGRSSTIGKAMVTAKTTRLTLRIEPDRKEAVRSS